MPDPVLQAAAIPVRDGLVCMVTSRSGRRWVFPKGLIDPGHTAPQAATQEAWEEAGLRGRLSAEPVGAYRYVKYGADHHVTVYLLAVDQEKAKWPEKSARRREWVTVEEAAGRVEEPELRELLRQLLPVVQSGSVSG